MPVEVPEIFDLCVIGCGPGGFAAAMRALDVGKHVCIVEGNEIGGAGVVWGALASKTMWELSKDFWCASKVDRGYRATGLTVDFKALSRTVSQAVKEKQYQMLSQIETFSPKRYNGPGSVTLKRGYGAFIDDHSIEVTAKNEDKEIVKAKNFLVSTGSKPRGLAHIAVDQETIYDSDGILRLNEFPRRLMIIGAGVIGCEYATIFSNFQQTKVYLLDHKDRILPFEDNDLSDFIGHNLEQNGVEIFHSAILRDIVRQPDHLEVILDFADGHSQVVEVDAALVAVGREPNLNSLNLQAVGIERSKSGHLPTDKNCCIKPGIYAAGDVAIHPQLVNIAEMEGRYAVKHMFGFTKWPLQYYNMSGIMFFNPEVALVGLNEKECQEKKIPYRVAYYANALVTRAIAMRALSGFVKIIVSDDEQQRLLGMRSAGPQASSTIMSIALLMDQDTGLRDVLKSIHPHPSMSESIQECLRLLEGKSVFKPYAFPKHMRIRRWNPESGFTE